MHNTNLGSTAILLPKVKSDLGEFKSNLIRNIWDLVLQLISLFRYKKTWGHSLRAMPSMLGVI